MLSNTPGKGSEQTPVMDLLSLERVFSMPKVMQPVLPNMDSKNLALYTDLRYIIMAADYIYSYPQAPTIYETFYVHVYYQYREWYCAKHGIEIK